MNSVQGSIYYFILRIFAVCVRVLPVGVSLFIGRRLGDIVALINAKGRRKAMQNLKIAFGHEKSPAELKRLKRDFYHAYGQNIVELGRLPLIAKEGYKKYVTVEGAEWVDKMMAKGRGLIFTSMHSGNWELSNIVGSMTGYPYNMVANYLKRINKVADFLDSLRQSAGCRIIHPGVGGREIIRRLKKNEIVTLVVDQGGREGKLVPFFGREASMSTGAVRIALKYDVPICLVDIHRVRGAQHHLCVEPFELVRTGNEEEDLRVNLLRLSRRHEELINQHPHEYIWFYKTWKYSSRRDILILDDGRTGHLRQSETVAHELKDVFVERGLSPEVCTLPVAYRSAFHAGLLGFLACFRWLPGVGAPEFLRFFLLPESFRKLFGMKPDVVISCGSRNAAVNVWLAKGNQAKNIGVLQQGLVPRRSFDLIVLPQHDVDRKDITANVVVTKAAPNLIDQDYLRANVRKLTARFSHLKMNLRPKIGLLIGGDTKTLRMTEYQIRIVVHQLKEIAGAYKADILLTTSRRTSAQIEQLLMAEFRDYERCALFILASRDSEPAAVGGILGLSDIVVVSGESISMVSEAAASGKKTVVFPIDGENRKPVPNKYADFVEKLGRQGHVIFAHTTGIAAAVDSALRNKIMTKPLNDRAILAEALRKMIE